MLDHEALVQRLDARFDKIEEKLDKHLEAVSQNRTDIAWVKGYIKLSLTALIAIATGVITTILKVFFK